METEIFYTPPDLNNNQEKYHAFLDRQELRFIQGVNFELIQAELGCSINTYNHVSLENFIYILAHAKNDQYRKSLALQGMYASSSHLEQDRMTTLALAIGVRKAMQLGLDCKSTLQLFLSSSENSISTTNDKKLDPGIQPYLKFYKCHCRYLALDSYILNSVCSKEALGFKTSQLVIAIKKKAQRIIDNYLVNPDSIDPQASDNFEKLNLALDAMICLIIKFPGQPKIIKEMTKERKVTLTYYKEASSALSEIIKTNSGALSNMSDHIDVGWKILGGLLLAVGVILTPVIIGLPIAFVGHHLFFSEGGFINENFEEIAFEITSKVSFS